MKYLVLKIYLILNFIVFLVLSFNSTVYAFENFEKSSSNPLTINFLPNYNEVFQTHIFKENNVFKGVFSVKSSINNRYSLTYGSSSNGIEWTIEKDLLTLDKNLFAPRVFLSVDGKIKVFFTKEDNPYRIYQIECDNNFNCQNSINLILEPLSGDPSENNGVFSGFPYYEAGKYYLFYGAWGNDGFKIKLATSNDGFSWTRCSGNQPIVWNADGSFLYKKENKYYLFSHSSDGTGIKFAESSEQLSCNMQWGNPQYVLQPTQNYDQKHLVAPSILELSNSLYLFYSGLGVDSIWRLNFAISQLPQPTPTPTPTPTPKPPLILLPGFMGSWNKEAILHNQPTSIFDWKLASYVREYDGIINTMKNLGYVENQDFLVFPYDWRKNLDNAADDLNNFLQQKIWTSSPEAKINIVGHSLGGLVSRIWAQKYNQDKVNKLITIGSPHQGTAQVYKAVEAGELDRWNNFLWLMEKLILILNKDSFETDKDTINQRLPVLKDILSTYDFLKKPDNTFFSINDMQIKNDALLTYNQSQQTIYPYLNSFVGDKADTLSGFNFGERTILDQLLNLYPDGRPISNLSDRGDLLTLSSSAGVGNNIKTLSLDHGEIIYTKDAIKEILNTLSIPYQESQIAEGRATTLSPSLLFFLKSPAQIEVLFNGTTYPEQDGLIFIEDAQNGDYQLKVKGQNKGKYTVLIGQIGDNNDVWNKIEGEITQDPPVSQIDTYPVNFNPQSPQSPLPPSSSFDELIYYLTDLNKSSNLSSLVYSINSLQQAKNFYQQQQKKKVKSHLLFTHSYLIIAKKKTADFNNKNKIFAAVEKLENLYHQTLADYTEGISSWRINQALTIYKQRETTAESYLLTQKNAGKNIAANALILQTINNKIKLAETYLNQNNLNFTETLLKSSGDLLNEVKKI